MYPVGAPQPIAEKSIGDGRPEPTNEAYAVAKLATASLAATYRKQYGDDYVTVIPTNLYGPGDNFDPLMSHVAPALMRRMIEARDNARAQGRDLGLGQAAPRADVRRRCRRRDRVRARALFRGRADQYRHRRRRLDPRARRAGRAASSATRASSPSTPASPTARRAGCSTTAGWRRSAGRRARRLPMGWTPCIAGTANTRLT